MDKKSLERIRIIFDNARLDGRNALYETEGLDILNELGFRVPARVFLSNSDPVESIDLTPFEGDRVVVKVVSDTILHKTDVGGVKIVPKNLDAVHEAVSQIRLKTVRSGYRSGISGFSVNQFVPYDNSIGGELLLGLRWTDDFGPVIAFGSGGIHAETLARHFKTGREIALYSPLHPPADGVGSALSKAAVTQIVSWSFRGLPARVSLDRLVGVCEKLSSLAFELCPSQFTDFEINPLVVSNGEIWALDALVKLGSGDTPKSPDRPVSKIRSLLEPGSIAIVGVSGKTMNPGRIILQNTIREGFDKDKIYLVKPGAEQIDGCRCYPEIRALPEKVDLIVLAIGASDISKAVDDIISGEKAESAIVIPGGMEEKAGGRESMTQLFDNIKRSRKTAWKGPVLNGGNSLGIKSLPGRYDTIFIPPHKLGIKSREDSKVAFISQSGAFAVAQGSKLASVGMRYTLSIGNQMDLTVGDYVDYLAGDPETDIFAVYVEGFKQLDGLKFLDAADRIVTSGRTVILYSGGRSEAGAHAAASHTASVAGNYAITRELALGCGVVVADTVADFEDLVMLHDCLRGRCVRGLRLGALSNAGFECVTMADNLRGFRFDPFTSETKTALSEVFTSAGIDTIVDVHNPLDLTPMSGDDTYEKSIRAVLSDDNVDVGVIGCVPHTARLNTLAPADSHTEDLMAEDSVVQRMIRLYTEQTKPWVAVVDGGPAYFAMRRVLIDNGVPTFKTADRALRLFSVFCESRLRHSDNLTA
jgi:acyl-CoA synthetase (NDP forming)